MKPMRVGDVMTRTVVSVREDTPFKELVRIMHEHRVGGVPVLDAQDQLTGIVTEADLLPPAPLLELPITPVPSMEAPPTADPDSEVPCTPRPLPVAVPSTPGALATEEVFSPWIAGLPVLLVAFRVPWLA